MILFPKPTPKQIARVIVGGILIILCAYCVIFFLQTPIKPAVSSSLDTFVYELGGFILGITMILIIMLIIIGLYKLFFE